MSVSPYNLFSSLSIQRTTSLDQILEPVRIFARSYGLHPFRILEVRDPFLRSELLNEDPVLAPGRQPVHLVVIAIRPVITAKHIDEFISQIRSSKKGSGHSLANYRRHVEEILHRKEGGSWSSRQADQALAILNASARDAGAVLSVNRQPDVVHYEEVLGLKRDGYSSHIAVTIRLAEPAKSWPQAVTSN